MKTLQSVLSLKYCKEIKGNTVIKYVRKNLYTKFNVINNKALKLEAIKYGYHKKNSFILGFINDNRFK